MNLYEKLLNIQSKLKAPKGQFNKFGNYKYRSCEDILEALKPLLYENKAAVTLSDEVKQIGNRYYIEATATFIDIEKSEKIEVKALAREDENKKGMDLAQVTGSVSSYARKYALNGLFAIDDNKDSDYTNMHGKEEVLNAQLQQAAIKPSEGGFGTVTFKPTAPEAQNNDYVITEKQLKRLITIGSNAGISYETIKTQVIKEFGIEPKQLKKSQYDTICKRLEAKAKK